VVADAVQEHFGAGPLMLVAHDASGLPAIDWALANPNRVATLVLLNTCYHWTAGLRRPPRIAVFSTPIIRAAARAIVRRWPGLDRRFFTWQVGGVITDPPVRDELVPELYEQSLPARPAVWRLNDDPLTAVAPRPPRARAKRRLPPPGPA